MMDWLFDFDGVSLDVAELVLKLVYIVLLPLIVGKSLRGTSLEQNPECVVFAQSSPMQLCGATKHHSSLFLQIVRICCCAQRDTVRTSACEEVQMAPQSREHLCASHAPMDENKFGDG